MAVYCKDPKSEIKRQGCKIISTRWIDTDKGNRANPKLSARGLSPGKSRRTSVRICFSATLPLETLKLLVADCAKGQRQAKPFGIGIFDESRGVLLRARDATPSSSIYPLKIGKKEMKAWLASYRSSFMVRETPAQNWAATNTKFSVKIGFQRGRASQLQLRAQEEEHQDDSAW